MIIIVAQRVGLIKNECIRPYTFGYVGVVIMINDVSAILPHKTHIPTHQHLIAPSEKQSESKQGSKSPLRKPFLSVFLKSCVSKIKKYLKTLKSCRVNSGCLLIQHQLNSHVMIETLSTTRSR